MIVTRSAPDLVLRVMTAVIDSYSVLTVVKVGVVIVVTDGEVTYIGLIMIKAW